MTDIYVSLDLEMTGVDLESDEIIEVGAVKFTRDGVLDRFATLVNPGRGLPRRIETLTGIRAAEVAEAPPFRDVQERFAGFVGDAAVVGQRIEWDLAFLAKHGLATCGPVLDTAELAEVLLPGLPDYGLRALTARLDIPFPVQHRALPDAEAAMAVFQQLCDRAAELDPRVLEEIVLLTASTTWPLRHVFRVAAEDAVRRGRYLPESGAGLADPLAQIHQSATPIAPKQRRETVSPADVTRVFEAAAADIDRFPTFEQRAEQLEMAEAVTRALSENEKLVVEAGTGTGKSMAYLLPAAVFALRNNQRVVISTNTINLQEQVVGKDIPIMRDLLDAAGPPDIRAALDDLRATPLKGRRNYLCLQRFAAMRRAGPQDETEARFLVRLLIWLSQTETGDRAELTLRQEEEPLWSRVNAQNSACFAGPSQFVRNGTCQLLRARKRADAAHLVVVNHALLLSDLAAGGSAMPNYDYLVIDEAHNLEDEATNQFGFQAGAGHVDEYLNSLWMSQPREAGVVEDVHSALRGPAGGSASHLHSLADALREAVDRARTRVPEVFGRVAAFVRNHAEGNGDYDNRLLLNPAKRAQPEWEQVELAWENLRVDLLAVEKALVDLHVALADADGADILNYDTLLSAVAAQTQTGLMIRKGIEEIVERHDGDRIAWITTNRATNHVSFSSAPLDVGDVLDNYLFSQKAGVVLTSATLSTSGTFDYVKQRLGIQDSEELLLGSPFDYKRAALLLVPSDLPEPSHPQHQKALEEALIGLCGASKGRALVLFTSHAALRATARATRRPLERQGVRVLAQGVDGTPAELLEQLKARSGTVIFGTSSFWEGVDVVGDALSLLIITKLPFSVPTDPVFAARSALFDEPFREYALPQAVLKFKQGFGRLIRHKADRGVVVVLDRRLRSKGYGRMFLDSLSACSVSEAPAAQLPNIVSRWLAARPS
ncbi:MAG: helicase C-terminal domain-containing protein [Dehalococcoidia bacterium]